MHRSLCPLLALPSSECKPRPKMATLDPPKITRLDGCPPSSLFAGDLPGRRENNLGFKVNPSSLEVKFYFCLLFSSRNFFLLFSFSRKVLKKPSCPSHPVKRGEDLATLGVGNRDHRFYIVCEKKTRLRSRSLSSHGRGSGWSPIG